MPAALLFVAAALLSAGVLFAMFALHNRYSLLAFGALLIATLVAAAAQREALDLLDDRRSAVRRIRSAVEHAAVPPPPRPARLRAVTDDTVTMPAVLGPPPDGELARRLAGYHPGAA
jgi:hypothetical protein